MTTDKGLATSINKKVGEFAHAATKWIGSPMSLIVHTLFFIASFAFLFFGVPLDKILLVVTTAVSFEAIYLSIFIQMTVNDHSATLEEVKDNIDDIQEDIDDIQEAIDEEGSHDGSQVASGTEIATGVTAGM